MSQNQEIIEAKLCAFIDGELDAEGRVEIEKHLEANPQHRRLLESLKATRDLIKWLPREAAPPEVAETLNGQLERSVLLDSESDFLRPTVWPRVLAAAAIVLLTAGLGLAVYFTLPKSQKSATPYVKNGPDTPGVETSEEPKSEEVSGRREPAGATLSKSGPTDMRTAAKSTGEPAANKSEVAKSEAEELNRWSGQTKQSRDTMSTAINGLQNQAALQNNGVASNAVVMLVRSNAPQATGRQVVSFLDAQKIQWKETSESAPAQQVALNHLNELRQRQQSEGVSQTSPQARQQVEILPTTATAQASANSSATTSTTQPAPTNAANGPIDRLAQAHQMYVARMSRQQAVSLNNTITQEPAQSTELKDLSGAKLTLEDLGAGKAPAPFVMANAAATTEPADPSQNADRFPARQLAAQPPSGFGGGGGAAGGFGGAGFGARPARGGGAAPAPTSQSAQQNQQADAQPPILTTQSSPDNQSAAATQSAATQTSTPQPADEPVDVLIVVESGPDSTPPPTSQPSTQPAATQP